MGNTKTGLFRIGFIENASSYGEKLKQLAELSGQTWIDRQELDDHIEEKWNTRDIICFDRDGNELDKQSNDISAFLIDTGFKTSTNQEILASFSMNTPSSLESGHRTGFEFGTKEDLFSILFKNNNNDIDFESYTAGVNYEAALRVLKDLTRNAFSIDECRCLIRNSFISARKNGELAEISSEKNLNRKISFFPLVDCISLKEQRLFVRMEINQKDWDSRDWFGAFIIPENELKELLLDYYEFHVGYFLFRSFDEVNSFLDQLAEKAMQENWCWKDANQHSRFSKPILKSYIEYTYYRLLDEDREHQNEKDYKMKIVEYDGKCYFNSGLLDRNFRQIIFVGHIENRVEQIPGIGSCTWRLLRNLQAYGHNEPEIAKNFSENDLPRIASYFTDYRQVIFDASLDIHTQDNHVFEDGVARGRLPKYSEQYNEVKDNPEEKDRLLSRIARDFDSARERAKLMAERNYKLAVPQYWRENGEIQFLLPIYLGEKEEAEKPQCALALSLDCSGRQPYYYGKTILTLDMAYSNTRLIAKPDVFWLDEIAKN